MNTFTEDQIKQLQADFEKIDRIDPCSETWLLFRVAIKDMPEHHLRQLGERNIKWLSDQCNEELTRRHKFNLCQ